MASRSAVAQRRWSPTPPGSPGGAFVDCLAKRDPPQTPKPSVDRATRPFMVKSFTKIAVQRLRPKDLQPAGPTGAHLRLRLHLSRRSATMILGLLGSHVAGGSWPAEG